MVFNIAVVVTILHISFDDGFLEDYCIYNIALSVVEKLDYGNCDYFTNVLKLKAWKILKTIKNSHLEAELLLSISVDDKFIFEGEQSADQASVLDLAQL